MKNKSIKVTYYDEDRKKEVSFIYPKYDIYKDSIYLHGASNIDFARSMAHGLYVNNIKPIKVNFIIGCYAKV